MFRIWNEIGFLLLFGLLLSGGRMPLTASVKSAAGAPEIGEWPIYAFCIDTHDSMKRTLAKQAALLEQQGFTGAGHLELPGVEERARTLAAKGLRLYQVYVSVDLSASPPVDENRIAEILPSLKPHGTQLALMIQGAEPSDASRDGRVVDLIRRISDRARPYGVRVVLYPHARFWLETSGDAVRLAEKVDRPGEVGVMFNLGHWLRSDPDRNLERVLEIARPWLTAVSINGSDQPETVRAGQGRWVTPLGEGEYDVGGFLDILAASGYSGPVGLQCYGIRGDAREHLARSMTAWKRMRARIRTSADSGSAFRREADAGLLKSFGTAGKAVYPLEAGREAQLFRYSGRGCLTHMWFGGNWKDYGRLRIRVSVDGEKIPSIDMELHMGHGIGFQDEAAPWGTKRIGKTGTSSGVYNTYRIPFGSEVRVTARLPEGDTGNPRFWYIIRGVENLPVEFNGVRLPERARLKLHKLEGYTAQTLEEFDLCGISGAGMLYQVTVAAFSESFQYLESCVRAYIDGGAEPILLSSGLEDYFLGTYFFQCGPYALDVAGLTHKDPEDHSFSAYRFHEHDPIFFRSGLRLTLRCGEKTERETWEAPPATYTTYVWAYEW